MELESIIISNNGYTVDSRNKNIHIRELELSMEDSDYVRNIFREMSEFLVKYSWLKQNQNRKMIFAFLAFMPQNFYRNQSRVQSSIFALRNGTSRLW